MLKLFLQQPKNVYLILLLVILSVTHLRAQDIHFSQFSSSPLNLAPSNSGLFDGDYRITANYRDQWRAVPVPYSTISFAAEMRNPFKYKQGDYTGAGFLFNHDISGDSRYATTQLYIPVSYQKKLSSDSSLFASIGLQPGITSIGFKTNRLTFDNQYDGDAYNASLSSGENFSAMNKTYFDLNASIGALYLFRPRANVAFSATFSHLTRPRISYFENKNIRLDLKQAYYLGASYPVATKLDVMAEMLYEKQGKYNELLFGGRLSYILSFKERQSVNLGFYVRGKDALIGRIGYEVKGLNIGLSYDVNTSKFIAATNKKGGWEVSLIYIFKKIVPYIAKKRICPIYM